MPLPQLSYFPINYFSVDVLFNTAQSCLFADLFNPDSVAILKMPNVGKYKLRATLYVQLVGLNYFCKVYFAGFYHCAISLRISNSCGCVSVIPLIIP